MEIVDYSELVPNSQLNDGAAVGNIRPDLSVYNLDAETIRRRSSK